MEPEKNANYVRPVFDGKFNSIQALARNLFEEDEEKPTLPQQREVHREELFDNENAFDTLNLHSLGLAKKT